MNTKKTWIILLALCCICPAMYGQKNVDQILVVL
jgi:hypothetical protein